jgi:hypothetical protein
MRFSPQAELVDWRTETEIFSSRIHWVSLPDLRRGVHPSPAGILGSLQAERPLFVFQMRARRIDYLDFSRS